MTKDMNTETMPLPSRLELDKILANGVPVNSIEYVLADGDENPLCLFVVRNSLFDTNTAFSIADVLIYNDPAIPFMRLDIANGEGVIDLYLIVYLDVPTEVGYIVKSLMNNNSFAITASLESLEEAPIDFVEFKFLEEQAQVIITALLSLR